MDVAQPDGNHHNQIDYFLVTMRFCSGVNIYKTRSFPGADIGRTMTWSSSSEESQKANLRLTFELEKLRAPDLVCAFQATVGEKCCLRGDDMDIDTVITSYNTELTDAASEILRE